MPPPESQKNPLTEEERSIVRRWIEQGAEYKMHWSFIAPQKTKPPRVKDSQWPRAKMDQFILSKIESLGISPSPEADKETLIRRVTLDLTGLPPTPAEIDDFIQDDREDAYEHLVDRLLQSPHYGERMALEWLDVSRYGDTNVHHVDLMRTSWPWRDWVIQAFNENKPYDEFIVEQVAGDMLENPTQDQILATSFNRNHPITNEGGAIAEEYLMEYAADRVHTVSTAFLGMTMACTRCHDHKYDPFSMEDYYSMISFFNNIGEVGLEKQVAREAFGYKPFITLPRNDEDKQQIEQHKKTIQGLVSAVPAEDFLSASNAFQSEHAFEWSQLASKFPRVVLNGKVLRGP